MKKNKKQKNIIEEVLDNASFNADEIKGIGDALEEPVKEKKSKNKKNKEIISSKLEGDDLICEITTYLAENNSHKYNLLKFAEELQELSLVLIQRVLKPTRITDKMISDELGDVLLRIGIFSSLEEDIFDKSLNKRLVDKANQYRTYINKKDTNLFKDI